MIIAVDGPAAAGKGTLARRLAERLGLAYLDTGLLYRAVGMALLRRRGSDSSATATAIEVAHRFDPAAALANPMLRSERVGRAASQVAAIPAVRAILLEFQRTFARYYPPEGENGAVMDGRDIGTVVCPDADCKLFVTASLVIRVRRRVKELQEQGMLVIEKEVLATMRERDRCDSERVAAPLVRGRDAFVLDTSEMDADAALAVALTYVSSRTAFNRVSI